MMTKTTINRAVANPLAYLFVLSMAGCAAAHLYFAAAESDVDYGRP